MTDTAPPPPQTVGALRALAASATSPAVERGVGVLLGASRDAAAVAVERLQEAGRLPDGLALVALLHAARRGTDAAGAVAELAAGKPLPEAWSDYELRAAAEEAEEDLRVGLRPPGPGAERIEVAGTEAPLHAAIAVGEGRGSVLVGGAPAGHLLDGLSLRRAVVDHGWVGRLAAAAGWPVVGRDAPGEEALRAVLEGPAGAPAPAAADGVDEVVLRSPAHLALLPPSVGPR